MISAGASLGIWCVLWDKNLDTVLLKRNIIGNAFAAVLQVIRRAKERLAMEPQFRKVVLAAKDFSAGAGKSVFASHERFGAEPGLRGGQTSTAREVVSVAGAGKAGSAVRAEFEVGEDFFSTPTCTREHTFVIRGMWDHCRYLDEHCNQLYQMMPTIGRFRIKINDKVVFDGEVYFWHYRQWRFWPRLELPIDESAFQPGKNVLEFANLTPPFEIKPIASHGQHCTNEELQAQAKLIPPEIPANSTYNLSDLEIQTRDLADLGILNSPEVVPVGEEFLVEVFATQGHELEFEANEYLEPISQAKLQPGRNKLFFTITKAGTNIEIKAGSKSAAGELSVIVSQAVAVESRGEFLLGHILGGHLTVFPVGHDYRQEVELFRDTGQGNLVAWLTEPRKAGDYITADMLPIDDIRQSKLKVVFRYYGNIPDPFPPDMPYPDEVRRMVEELGDAFYALAPHERSGYLNDAIGQTRTRPEAVEKFSKLMKGLMDECHAMGKDVKAFVTDPSLLSFVYRREGADMPAMEAFPLHFGLNMSSLRGVAKTYGDAGWAVINSFECQGWGGLPTLEPMADQVERYDEKRGNLWWLSQYLLYFAGARVIYSESGGFHQVVTRHLSSDDPQIIKFRRTQHELFEFAKVHPFDRQPAADFAYIHSEDDVFSDLYVPLPKYTEASDATWERVRVAFPKLWWRNDMLRGLTTTVNARIDFADSPFGEVDILTLRAKLDVLGQYGVLVLVGRHKLTAEDVDVLYAYVAAGGQVIVNLVDFVDEPGKLTSGQALTKLCGVKANEDDLEKGFLWEIEVVDRQFDRDYDGVHIHCIRGFGAYDGLVLGDVEPEGSATVIIRDKYTQTPFLIRNQIGKGQVWFLNMAQHHANRQFQLLANSVVESVFNRTELVLRRVEGEYINHIMYLHSAGHGKGKDEFYQVFTLNNDWFTEKAVHSAVFVYDQIKFGIDVRRNRVTQFFLLPGMVLLPDSDRFRIDGVRRADSKTMEIELQGIGETAIKLCTRRTIQGIEISGADGSRETINRELCAGGAEFTVSLNGVHRLRVEFC